MRFRGLVLLIAAFPWLRVQAQEIQVGRPKVWLYDRLYPNLDGLLRDTEGISLASLTGLDPNALNARVVDFLQNIIQASVTADQTAAIQNSAAQSLFKSAQGLLGSQTTAAQTLSAQKLNLLQSLAQAMTAQQARIAALPSGATCASDSQCQQLQQNVTDLTAMWTALGTASTAIGSPGTLSPPSLTGVTASGGGSAPSLANLIDPKTFLSTALASTGGSLPPREQLENFITLLNDRLTKELALSLDEDGLRGDYTPVVMEFDVSINPGRSRKNQTATAEFNLGSGGCKPPIVYNLYPSLSAFNVADVQGKSSAFMLNGGLKGLFLGGSGSYQREHDRITQALRQSVYMSGFRSGQSDVGWVYRPPAFTDVVRPGMYSTFAVVLVPNGCGLDVQGMSHWNKKGRPIDPVQSQPASFSDLQAANQPPTVTHVQYDPHYASADDLQTDVNVITVDFQRPINPNLMIAAAGKLLKRVRDWRGRATTPGSSDTISVTDSAGNSHQISRARGLFEADMDEADTWIAVTQTKIMLKLRYVTAGGITFPEIRLLTPGGATWNLQQLVDYRHYNATVTMGQREFLACHPKPSAALIEADNQGCMRQPASMWLPLFVVLSGGAHTLRVARTNGDAPDNSGMPPGTQTYFFLAGDDGRTALSPRAQVVLAQPGHSRFPHPIPVECSGLMGGLLCHTHPQSMLYGLSGSPCMNGLVQGTPPTLKTGSDECKIENYPMLRIEVTQPGSKANPTFYAAAVLPAASGPTLPVIGAVSGFSAGPASLHYTFPLYGLAAGTSVELRAGGVVIAGTTATVAPDSTTGRPVLTAEIPDGEATVKPLLDGRIHLYANGADLGALSGMRDAIIPADLNLTIQGRFYQFTGAHLDAVRKVVVGPASIAPTPYDSGLVADTGDPPAKDELLKFNIAGVERPVVACVTPKPADTAAPDKPSNPASQANPPAPTGDANSLEVTTTTKVKTGAGATAQASAASPDASSGGKPAAAAPAQPVCGPIVVAAAPKGAPKPGAPPESVSVMSLGVPAPPPPQNALQDAAKQIYLAPEPVKK